MLIRREPEIPWSEITSEKLYRNRREFIKAASAALAVTAGGLFPDPLAAAPRRQAKLGPYDTDETQTPYEHASSYNNYYEFGTDKEDPAQYAHTLKTSPWHVRVEGMVEKPGNYALDDLLRGLTVYDRVYRMRCVEGWSMVIPWQGVQLSDLLKKFVPTSSAKFVEFTTLADPEQMPGLSSNRLKWPYVEGLRLDEANHPLTIMATGMYGRALPNQNGAPFRLVVPWKYGFKGIKSIVRIRLTDQMPANTWNVAKPHEYGFYANVNPNVDHPRWSQKTERRLTGSFFGDLRRIPTRIFNGYDQVASLYAGMDLRKWY